MKALRASSGARCSWRSVPEREACMHRVASASKHSRWIGSTDTILHSPTSHNSTNGEKECQQRKQKVGGGKGLTLHT